MSWAQAPHRRPQPAPLSQLIEQHGEALELTDDQVAALTSLDATTRAELEALRADESLAPEDRRAAARDIMEQTRAAVAEILTEAQREQWQTLRPERGRRPDPAEREARMAQQKELFAALKAYHAENIAPVMRAQRQKLEANLSAEDRATIAQLREEKATAAAEMKARKEAFKAQREQAREENTRPDREARKIQMAERREALRTERQAFKAQLDPLLAKYDTEITALLEEIADQRNQWDADRKAIHEQYAPEDGDRPAPRQRRGKARSQRPHGPDRAQRPDEKQMSKARFLLLDPAATPQPDATPEAELNRLDLYPNPSASGETTVTLRMLQPGPARVELRTENGRVLRVIADSKFTAGEHTLSLTTQGLRPGVYYLSLSDAAGTRTERLVVN